MPYPYFPADSITVLVGRDLIGDALIKLPFLRALRAAWPNAKISWVTTEGPSAYASTLREATKTLLDEVIEKPDWTKDLEFRIWDLSRKPFSQMPNPKSQILLDTRNRWKLAVAARGQIPNQLFIALALRHLLSDRKPPLWLARPPHMVDRLLQMVELAAGYQPKATGRLPVPADMLAKARQLLPEGPTYIGLAPGAGNPIKIWPRYKFEKLAEAQAAKGRVPVFLLGPQELDWYEALKAHVPTARFPLQEHEVWQSPQITLDQTLAVGSCLTLAVANDSGTGHMLAAVDCPLISLFGPTSPSKLAPRVTHGFVVKAQDFGGSTITLIHWEAVDNLIENVVIALQNEMKL